jgi:hypothetical protein
MAVWLMDSDVQPHDYAKGKRLLFKIPLSEAESHEKEIQRVPSVLEIDIFLDEKEAKEHGFICDNRIRKISEWFI